MTQQQQQHKFAIMVAKLILKAEELDYEVTFGDAWAQDLNDVWDFLNNLVKNHDKDRSRDILYMSRLRDTVRKALHRRASFHYRRLAIDINLFKDGIYLRKTEDHKPLGDYWQSLGGTWGGAWDDGNHYSLGE